MNMQAIEAIRHHGKPYIAVPKATFRKMVEALEELDDIETVREALRAVDDGEEETFPAGFVYALAAAKHPSARIALWRKHRGFSRAELGRRTGVTGQFIGLIEAKKRKGDIALYRKLADALFCHVEDLI